MSVYFYFFFNLIAPVISIVVLYAIEVHLIYPLLVEEIAVLWDVRGVSFTCFAC